MECTVCMEAYDHEARRPKSLPCGHSFCLQCLQNPAIKNLCPQDRQGRGSVVRVLPAPVRGRVRRCRPQAAQRAPTTSRSAAAGSRRGGAAAGARGIAAVGAAAGPRRAELRRELQETQRQMQELRPRGAQPAPRLELDVEGLSTTRRLRKERNNLLLGDQLTQVRKLIGLNCGVDAAWAEAVLLKVGPHVEKLHVENVKLQHLRVIQGMPALKQLHLDCDGLRANVDVPLLPLQLERLTLEGFRKGHLASLQWMPRLRNLSLTSNEDIPLTFSPMPDHCGIRKMTVNFGSTATLLSLVRAHAATLEVLSVNIASSDEYETGRPNFSRQLHQCDLVALRELNLDREDGHHDKHSCRVQMRAFRKRFGPDVVVECSECNE